MARYYGADVLKEIKTLLEENLNTKIFEVSSERSLPVVLDKVISFRYGSTRRQYPECMIMAKDSDIKSEELNLDIDDTSEIYPIDVMILIKDNTDDVFLKQEYYIEALQKVLHGYASANISWVTVRSGIRADAFSDQSEILKVAGVSIDVRIL